MLPAPCSPASFDLELFAGDSRCETLRERTNRYEIIDGELFVTKAPNWVHQTSCANIATVIKIWSDETGLGEVAIAPGIIFSDADNVIPDVVWASHERLKLLLDEAGHLIPIQNDARGHGLAALTKFKIQN